MAASPTACTALLGPRGRDSPLSPKRALRPRNVEVSSPESLGLRKPQSSRASGVATACPGSSLDFLHSLLQWSLRAKHHSRCVPRSKLFHLRGSPSRRRVQCSELCPPPNPHVEALASSGMASDAVRRWPSACKPRRVPSPERDQAGTSVLDFQPLEL